MAYDFTADSDIQTTLSGELTAQASEFETQVSQLYSEIDGLASSWKGEDYTAFNEGAHGYEKALADLKESIDLFAKHFERLSAGTEELAVSLATIIENALEGGEAGGSSGSGGTGGSGDSADQDAARGQTKSDGSVNPYGGGRPDRVENPDGSYSYVYRDKDGNIRQKDTWDKDGNLIGQETYDEDGKTKNYSMQVDQTDGSYVVEKFDGDNILSHEERDADDKLIKSIEYGYDADGNNNLKTTTNADGTRFEEDISNDETVGIRVYDENNELQFENKTENASEIAAALAAGASYTLGPNGMYRIDSKDADGTVETVYDKDGSKRKCKYQNSDGTSKLEYYNNGEIEETFEYDSDGNPTAHYKVNEDGELVLVVEGELTDASGDDSGSDSDGTTGDDGTGSDGDSDGATGSDGTEADLDATAEEKAEPVKTSYTSGDIVTIDKSNYGFYGSVRKANNEYVNIFTKVNPETGKTDLYYLTPGGTLTRAQASYTSGNGTTITRDATTEDLNGSISLNTHGYNYDSPVTVDFDGIKVSKFSNTDIATSITYEGVEGLPANTGVSGAAALPTGSSATTDGTILDSFYTGNEGSVVNGFEVKRATGMNTFTNNTRDDVVIEITQGTDVQWDPSSAPGNGVNFNASDGSVFFKWDSSAANGQGAWHRVDEYGNVIDQKDYTLDGFNTTCGHWK